MSVQTFIFFFFWVVLMLKDVKYKFKIVWTCKLLQVITVEPGCYFIDAVLVPAMENSNTSGFFNCEQISRFRGFGGVRIESDVVILLLNLSTIFAPKFSFNYLHKSSNHIFNYTGKYFFYWFDFLLLASMFFQKCCSKLIRNLWNKI